MPVMHFVHFGDSPVIDLTYEGIETDTASRRNSHETNPCQ